MIVTFCIMIVITSESESWKVGVGKSLMACGIGGILGVMMRSGLRSLLLSPILHHHHHLSSSAAFQFKCACSSASGQSDEPFFFLFVTEEENRAAWCFL